MELPVMVTFKHLVLQIRLPVLVVCVVLLAGCRALVPPSDELSPESLESDTPIQDAADSQQDAEPPTALTDPNWILRVAELGKTLDEKSPRWRHIGLEDLLAQPTDSRPDLKNWLEHKNPVVAANAAIGLARLGEAAAGNRLVATVRAPKLRIPQRQAAAEALGLLDTSSDDLQSLLKQYGDFSEQGSSNYRSELHTVLLRSLFSRDPQLCLGPLTQSLTSPAKSVRLEAVHLWRRFESEELPDQMVEMVSDVDPQIRIEVIGLLASRGHEQTASLARKAITDQRMDVRLAAISALGSAGGESARPILIKLKSNLSENMRAAAVAALAELGAVREVLAASEDESRHVRQAVAESLHRNVEPHTVSTAHKLLKDRSIEVSTAVVESIIEWPLDRSGPIWIAALESNSLALRRLAVKSLSPHWPVAKDFPADSNARRRNEALEKLREKWEIEFPGTPLELATADSSATSGQDAINEPDPKSLAQVEVLLKRLSDSATTAEELQAAEQSLLEFGPNLPDLLAHLVEKKKTKLPDRLYDKVFPKLDPAFELLSRLESIDVAERRQAATALSVTAKQKPLNLLALERLVQTVTPEPDDLVWRSVQEALSGDLREPATRLHLVALSHPNGEVRRRACEHLRNHPRPVHEAALVAALGDTSPAVRLAAVRAIGQLEEISNPLPLVRLLASREKTLVLATASSLARLGYENGGDALERLSHDRDAGVRRQTAQAMGTAGEPRFVGTLVRLLGDQLNVKRAALDSLRTIHGQDIGLGDDSELPAMGEQIRRWRQWHYQNQARGNTSTPAETSSATRRVKKPPTAN